MFNTTSLSRARGQIRLIGSAMVQWPIIGGSDQNRPVRTRRQTRRLRLRTLRAQMQPLSAASLRTKADILPCIDDVWKLTIGGNGGASLRDVAEETYLRITTTVTYDGNPPRLFKFWTMPSEGAPEEEHLRDLLVRHKLFFRAANLLNDPYDCLPAIFADFTPERAKVLFERQIKRESPDLSDADCAAEVERRIATFDFKLIGTPEFQLGALDAFKELRKGMAVYCLTERVDSVLMWSHYARNHTGFAVMFDGTDPFIGEAQRVRYERNRPLVDPGAREERIMHAVLLVKARDWKYEQEWRITRINRPGLHEFNPKALTGIVFGMAMPQVDRDRLRGLCREGGLNTKYYQAVDDARSFNARIVEA